MDTQGEVIWWKELARCSRLHLIGYINEYVYECLKSQQKQSSVFQGKKEIEFSLSYKYSKIIFLHIFEKYVEIGRTINAGIQDHGTVVIVFYTLKIKLVKQKSID